VAEDRRDRGAVFTTTIEVVEWMGSELYAHFSIAKGGIEAEELRELAEESGTDELGGEEADRVIARLDAASRIREGNEAEVWLDLSKLHFFDLDSSQAVTSSEPAAATA
jgi:multiple sugar transport system ATP-binding protein